MVLFLFLANSLKNYLTVTCNFYSRKKSLPVAEVTSFSRTYDPLLVGSSWNLKSEKKQHKRKYPTMKIVQQISQKKRYLGILLISLYILTNDKTSIVIFQDTFTAIVLLENFVAEILLKRELNST